MKNWYLVRKITKEYEQKNNVKNKTNDQKIHKNILKYFP